MNKIIINRGSFKLNEVEFEQGTTTIGRASNNTIILDDSAVSSCHAKIVTLFNTSYIEDLDSTNGTMVNGKSVQKRALHSGDIISLGNHQLLFQSDESCNRATDETSETVVLKGGEIKQKLTEFIQAQTEIQNSQPASHHEPRTPDNLKSSAAPDYDINAPKNNAAHPHLSAINQNTNGGDSLDAEKNRAWLDPKPNPGAAQIPPSAENVTPLKTRSTPVAMDTPRAEGNGQPAPQIVHNTAAAIRSITPPQHSPTMAPATEKIPVEDSPTQKFPVDIAAAARSALHNRRAEDMNNEPHRAAKDPLVAHSGRQSSLRRKSESIHPMADNAFANKSGAMVLNHRRLGIKILPIIWLFIVAVLIVEVLYITYRSLT